MQHTLRRSFSYKMRLCEKLHVEEDVDLEIIICHSPEAVPRCEGMDHHSREISDTLTLQHDCMYEQNGHPMICIRQM